MEPLISQTLTVAPTVRPVITAFSTSVLVSISLSEAE